MSTPHAPDLAAQNAELRARLSEAEETLEAIFNAAPIGLAITKDPEGRHIRGNPASERIFGLPRGGELPVRAPEPARYCALQDGRELPAEQLPIQRAVRGETVSGQILQVLRPDGQTVTLECNAVPLRDEQGRPHGAVGAFIDVTERERGEAALARQHAELQLILDSTPALIFYKDRENRFLRVNRALADSMGVPKEQLEGKSLFDLYPRQQAEAYWRHDQEVLASGRAKTDIVEPMQTPAGERWVQTGKVPCRDARGNIIGVIGFSLDITDRQRAERDLAAVNQRLQALMQALPVGVSFSDDATCQRITGNPAVLAQFGVTDADNLSASASDPSAPGRQVRFFRNGQPITDADLPLQRAVAENREVGPMQLEVLLPNGRHWFAEASGAPVHDQQGKVVGGVAVTLDITGRKQTEQALRQSQARAQVAEAVQVERRRLQDVLNMLPAYVILLTPDHHVPFANRFFEERFGKSEGRRCYEYLFHRTEPCEICETFKVLKTNTPLRWEWTGPDGRNYDIHDFPFTDVDGSPLIMEVGLDITERKKVEAELAKHREHLQVLVDERTAELRASNAELVRFNQAMVGRELRMVELKREVNDLCVRLGQPPRYQAALDHEPETPTA